MAGKSSLDNVTQRDMAEESKQSDKVDGYGFERDGDFDHSSYDEFMSRYLAILSRRSIRWSGIVSKKNRVPRSRKVKRYCRKGIPNEHRPMVWMCVSGAQESMASSPLLYQTILKSQHDESTVEAITIDLHRTFPDNIYFSANGNLRGPLFNVLIALSHKNSDQGYCQGVNFVAGLLLLIVKNEEKVFWLLDTLMNDILPDFYAPDMKATQAEQELLGEIIKWKAPDLHAHLKKMDIQWCLVATKWFLCLFADVMPVETTLRIWDCLFYEGDKILLRVAAMLIIQNKDQFLRCRTFTETMDFFKQIVNNPKITDCHAFLQKCFTELGPFPKAKIKALREECMQGVK
ncbi:growth hormone-regulated TBC protein 1-A-like isoform X1 [Mizuhopecten yessoensis]|uniref:growth hormone-regulated TBC protein 1-A-like isoform X1 n=1 Tax=Mizuhopecten yessoensis TaxID=6573 RepID=UPI000B45E49E|nr:growth hormone-regulated TBC protein 1-A-like isoform X1 [Mizuhopecten yessoensis]